MKEGKWKSVRENARICDSSYIFSFKSWIFKNQIYEFSHNIKKQINLTSLQIILEETRYTYFHSVNSVQFSHSIMSLCDPMECSSPGFPAHHQLPELAQTHVHQVGDAIQPSHPLLSPSPPAFNLAQHQGLFQWVSSSHQVAKILEFRLQSFQGIFRTDFL